MPSILYISSLIIVSSGNLYDIVDTGLKGLGYGSNNSKPEIKIENQERKYDFIASISHEKKYAIAIAISNKN